MGPIEYEAPPLRPKMSPLQEGTHGPGIPPQMQVLPEVFRPDPRNRRHQRYCAAPRCRRASKAASQARWLGKPANQGYFRDAWHVARVRAWRSRHPGYWRRAAHALHCVKDVSTAQSVVFHWQNGRFSCAHRYKIS